MPPSTEWITQERLGELLKAKALLDSHTLEMDFYTGMTFVRTERLKKDFTPWLNRQFGYPHV